METPLLCFGTEIVVLKILGAGLKCAIYLHMLF